MRLALLGFGLIGGSIARALHARRGGTNDAMTISAWSPSGEGPAAATRDGVIDVAAPDPEAAIAGADLVVLAGPPTICLAQLDELAGAWQRRAGAGRRRHRRRQHEGSDRRPREIARLAVRRRSPDGRTRVERLRRLEP